MRTDDRHRGCGEVMQGSTSASQTQYSSVTASPVSDSLTVRQYGVQVSDIQNMLTDRHADEHGPPRRRRYIGIASATGTGPASPQRMSIAARRGSGRRGVTGRRGRAAAAARRPPREVRYQLYI